MECIYNTGGYYFLHESECTFAGWEEGCPEAEEG